MSLEEFIQPYLEKDVIFLNNKPYGDDVPCAGFYICKVTPYTKDFICNWYNVHVPLMNKIHPWEQKALWDIYKEYNVAVVDSWMFQEEEGQFLRHIPSCEAFNRLPYFYMFLLTHTIDYLHRISNIECIDFDTIPFV
jgi:hypothetical protein